MTQTQVQTQEQAPRRVPPGTLAWLEHELEDWQAEGRLDAATAAGIRGRYEVGNRLPLARLMLGLGAAFVGVGLVWLVAANIEQLSPLVRFTGVVAVWLSLVVAAEKVRGSATAVAALQGLAAAAFGAVVFQAAQSLQVPAYAEGLVGLWAAGALLYAYAVVGRVPLLVGAGAGVMWLVLTVVDRSSSAAGAALALLLAGVVAGALTAVHAVRVLPAFASTWRAVSGLLLLAGLFVAAFPGVADGEVASTPALALGAVVLAVAGAAALLADRPGRQEVAAAVAVAVAGLLVLRWAPPGEVYGAPVEGEQLGRALVAVAAYLAAAVWIAALGVLRQQPELTRLATAALVLFTVVQSFAIFEPILSGAALFLALGAVLAGTGVLVERGRRRFVQAVDSGDDPDRTTGTTGTTATTATTSTTTDQTEDGA